MNNLWIAAFVNASALILATQGFTLMYKTTRVPNFSIGVFMTLGAYVTYTNTKIIGLPLYLGALFAFISGAIVSIVISIGLIEPMISRNRTRVQITIATIAIGMVLENIIRIIVTNYKPLFDGGQMFHLHLRQFDFKIGELKGGFIVSTIVVFGSILLLRYLFKKTVFGLSSRAIEENYELAQVQGINLKRNRIILWTLAGGMASLSGALMLTHFCHTISFGTWITPTILAAALLGGMDSETGATVGGLITGLLSIIVPTYGQATIGVWFGEYQFMIPLTIIVAVTTFAPNGILGTDLDTRPAEWIMKLDKRKVLALVVVLICGITITSTLAERNRIKARTGLMDNFTDYEIVVMERPQGIHSSIGNLIMFKAKLKEFNITTVYVEPYSDSSTHFTFYYERNHVRWTTVVRLELHNLYQYRINYGS